MTERIQVIDLFSGCGGLSAGFASGRTERAEFEIVGALDTNDHANATYRRMLGVEPKSIDATKLLDGSVLRKQQEEWEIRKDQPLVVVGGPPCQGFSSHRKKDRRVDERNSFVEAFAQISARLDADVVVMENVPEMFRSHHWEYFEAFRTCLASEGYTVRAQIHNLAEFGVPQERYRALVIAARDWEHFRMPEGPLKPSEFQTVRQAIGHLKPLRAGESDPEDPMHITSRHRKETVNLIKLIPEDGGSRSALPQGVGPACWEGVDGFRDVYGRMSWDKPANAITARCRTPSTGRFVHPAQHRGLTVREAALLQGFPSTWQFEGPFDEKFRQIGNAVSPIFSQAVAEHLLTEWYRDHSQPVLSEHEFEISAPLTKSFSSSIASLKRRQRADVGVQPSLL